MGRPSLLPFFRIMLATPLVIYSALTTVGVVYDAERGMLAWHPDGLLIFEVIGLTFCAAALILTRSKTRI